MNPPSNLASRLAELPEFDPPESLWARIEAAHGARNAQRRRRFFGAAGGALAASIALATLLLHPLRSPNDAPDLLGSLRGESQRLEAQLSGAHLMHTSATLGTELELRRLDTTLQHAYEHGADSAELAPLWRRRNELLGVLLQLQLPDQQISEI
jgi:hypothetical protein